ncbi:MAG: polyribonucleotide nucleotidyltransferase [Candidatus Melainabacteria bacterium RIFCSPHIGHO2_02_FULL_34_12]|nr:MAG: polyribonucleotide nucleotidyltransferase [Candidatus Melainabacteria bacterium RIFCSPHIGHO2_02_FULL_34_12]
METKTPESNLNNNLKEVRLTINGKEIIIQTGKLAKQANGSVTVQCGDTMLLVTAVKSDQPREDIDFFPLLCDFEERISSVGRIPGSYNRRENKPPDKSTLTARLMDRPLRPLFPEGFYNDVQVVATTLSTDQINPPDVLAMLGASFALEISDIPFNGPIGAVRIGMIHNKFIANPTFEEIEKSELDLVVAGTSDSIMMVEAGAKLVSEEVVLNALAFAQGIIKQQVEVQKQLAKLCNVKKLEFTPPEKSKELIEIIEKYSKQPLLKSMDNVKDKATRNKYTKEAKEKVTKAIEDLKDGNPLKELLKKPKKISAEVALLEETLMRKKILEEGIRADGRKCNEVRQITSEVGILPRVHGTGLFTRGTTQVLSSCTLGTTGDAQKLDGTDPQTEKRYLHHYNFPGYSVGEVKPSRTPARREIGHGNLAERAILPVLPDKEHFPYTIRVVSEVLESNGSTSMASTCGSTLSLMDAGVPIKAPIAGVAMGLIKEGDRFAILTDIQGLEDFLGDMDFKVTGSKKGISALQMDIKIQGITLEIMKIALEQARTGRLFILEKMLEVLPKPRTEMSKWAPRILTLKVDMSDIGTIIGPGGKMIRRITEETGAKIDIEEDGTVLIASPDNEKALKAKKWVQSLVEKIQPGTIYSGKVVRIAPIGAFVEILPNKEGLVHISQLQDKRTEKVEDVVKLGDVIAVRVREIDERGRLSLTMRGITKEEADKVLTA